MRCYGDGVAICLEAETLEELGVLEGLRRILVTGPMLARRLSFAEVQTLQGLLLERERLHGRYDGPAIEVDGLKTILDARGNERSADDDGEVGLGKDDGVLGSDRPALPEKNAESARVGILA